MNDQDDEAWDGSTMAPAQAPWSVTRSAWLFQLELLRQRALDEGYFVLSIGPERNQVAEGLCLLDVERWEVVDCSSDGLLPCTLHEITAFLDGAGAA